MPFPPLEFLFDASSTSMQDLELSALNRSANLSKVIRHELELWIEQAALAMVARWMIENRDKLLEGRTIEVKPKKADFFAAIEEKKSA